MMKKSAGPAVMILTVLLSFAGAVLRALQLAGGTAGILIGLSAVSAAVFLVLSLLLPRRRCFDEVFAPDLLDLIFSAAGSVLLAVGCVLLLLGSAGAERYIGALGLVGALVALRGALLRYGAKPVSALYSVPAVLFYVLKLFVDFRKWMLDPSILDYCFMLFASICFMMAFYYAGSFSFNRGSRRALAFFSMSGVYFGVMSMAGLPAAQLMIYGGSSLCLLACVRQTMQKRD